MPKGNLYIISLGGSMLVPGEINALYIKKFIKLIREQVANGHRFIIITGGGRLAREYQAAAAKVRKVTDTDKDWVGIYATHMNAQFLRVMFEDDAHDEILINPTKKMRTTKPVIVGAGWIPGCSTDKDAVLAAETYNVKTIINLSNIEKVYTKDPKKYKTAQPIDEISWKDYRKIVGDKWIPGANFPFDPMASKHAQKLGLQVVFMDGKKLSLLKKYFDGKKVDGTVIG